MSELDSVDYKALYEQVQQELEAARITILGMRNARNPLGNVNVSTIRAFVNQNYVVIVVAIMLLSLIVSFLKTFRGFRFL